MVHMDPDGNSSTCCAWTTREPAFTVRNVVGVSHVAISGFCGEPVVTTFLHLFMLIMFLLSVALNLLLISVIAHRKVAKPVHLFILNLAFADLLGSTAGILAVLPMLITKTSYIRSEVCLVQVLLVYLFGGAIGGIITTMAMDRYVAICNPLMYHAIFYRRRNISILVLTWVGSLTIATIYMGLCVRILGKPLLIMGYICEHLSISKALEPSSTFDIVFNVLMIFVIIVVCFSWQYYTYKKIFKEIKSVKGTGMAQNSKLKLAEHLLIPVFTYLVGFVMYSSCIAEHFICHPWIINTKVLSQALYYTAVPALNPVMYGLRKPEVRKYIASILRSCHVPICKLLHLKRKCFE